MVTGTSTDYQAMPMAGVRKARMTIRRVKVRIPKAKERKENENRKEKKAIRRAKAKAKTRKEKVWQLLTRAGSQDILLETVGETVFDRLQVIQPIHLQGGLQ